MQRQQSSQALARLVDTLGLIGYNQLAGCVAQRGRTMKRSEVLWLAFEKFAIFFSFVVTFFLVMLLLLLAFATWQHRDVLRSLKEGLVCDTVTGLNDLMGDLENAVITRTIPISETIPVRFDLPLDKNLDVQLTENVRLNRPLSFVFPAGGGRINGTVNLVLPEGQVLPVHMSTVVEVSQTLPVEMEVYVAIPLKETELGGILAQLNELLAPLQLQKLEKSLQCRNP
jgi:hypothetical protein